MANPPVKRIPKLSVAIPASLVSDIPHLREKTLKLGLVGRALAIFRVDEVIVFPDRSFQSQTSEIDLTTTILSYMETPQYLRKVFFKIRPELRYVGVLAPLRTPHHPLTNRKRDLRMGEYREGIVVASDQKRSLVQIGVEQPVPVIGVQVPVNTRITVRIAETGKRPKASVADRDAIEAYWGYKVTAPKQSLGTMLKEKSFDLVVATSRLGEPFTRVAEKVLARWGESTRVLIVFGSPTEGLHDMLRKERLRLGDLVDFVVNMIPNQATETVRTEEALYTTLAVLNLLTAEKT